MEGIHTIRCEQGTSREREDRRGQRGSRLEDAIPEDPGPLVETRVPQTVRKVRYGVFGSGMYMKKFSSVVDLRNGPL